MPFFPFSEQGFGSSLCLLFRSLVNSLTRYYPLPHSPLLHRPMTDSQPRQDRETKNCRPNRKSMIFHSSCNVTRTITTRSEAWQKGDTSVIIQSKTVETYDASRKLP